MRKMVEHTSINPNKAAHIGHVRNAVLGDTFVRILQAAGDRVEVQNYIDNTGVQVADVVVGSPSRKDGPRSDQSPRRVAHKDYPFDYYCWDLYTKVGLFYRDGNPGGDMNPEKAKLRNDVLHAIEAGDNAIAARRLRCDAQRRVHSRHDGATRHSLRSARPRVDILHLHFWERAFALMKAPASSDCETKDATRLLGDAV